MDPLIPRHVLPHGQTTTLGPTWAKLVRHGDDVTMVDVRRGYALSPRGSMAALTGGGWGNPIEGVHRAPRPWVYNGDTVVVEGDVFVVVFVDGNHRHPVILGYARTPFPVDPDFFPSAPLGEDPNPIRVRAAARDENTGAVTGTLQIRALDGGAGFEIIVGGAKFGEGTRVTIDHDAGTVELVHDQTRVLLDGAAGTVKLGQGQETHPASLGDEIVSAISEISDMLIALDGVIAAKLAPTPPSPVLAQATALKVKCTTSLSAGAPLLSSIVRVQ